MVKLLKKALTKPTYVLVVEDEKATARALELKLEEAGFKVTVAPDGDAALKFIGKKHFDLILLDLILPHRDGFHLLKEFRTRAIKAKIIVLTNLAQEEDKQRAREAGALLYLVKSDWSLAEMVAQVKKTMRTS